MKLNLRAYRELADVARMRTMLADGIQANCSASYMPPGYLDWDTHYPPDEAENRRNLLLWERSSETGEGQPVLEAWATYSRHEKTFDLFVSPDVYGTPTHATVMDEYLVWAVARAREVGITQLSPFWVFDHDTVTDRLLKERGFSVIEADPPAPLFERSLDELPLINLPEGFTVEHVKNLDDGKLRAQVSYSAFRRQEAWEHYWSEYAGFIGSPVYDGKRDLFVRSPDGRGASICTIWFDHVNKIGLFEPVATHADFQGQGLGKAVMAEGMRRMKAAGMRRAILGFDPNNTAARALYTSIGFRAACYFMFYQKQI